MLEQFVVDGRAVRFVAKVIKNIHIVCLLFLLSWLFIKKTCWSMNIEVNFTFDKAYKIYCIFYTLTNLVLQTSITIRNTTSLNLLIYLS